MKRQFGDIGDVNLFIDILNENLPFNHTLKYRLINIYGKLILSYKYVPIPANWSKYII